MLLLRGTSGASGSGVTLVLFVLVLRGSRFLVPDGLLARTCPLVDMAALAGGAGLQFLGVKIAA